MKLKVIQRFRDKYTNEFYKINQILEVDEKRFNELIKEKDYVSLINEEITIKSDQKKGKIK